MKKKNYFHHVWEWMLELGPFRAFLLLETIGLIVGILVMWALHWFDQHYH